ncbi:neuroblastoma-amplified sequence [Aplysia californica]|uniref:Neuroblastoma-amplified sequence n=1 Tax=Aplysia californica TaxID=6500 RepID=A0ABM1A4L9_APLCA|nr:neuroblastoma-amplified sequence [Aplysia californica]
MSIIWFRSQRDGLENLYGKGSIPQEPYPQWRCVVWVDDETMVACSRSSGAVDVFDIVGSLLFTIPGTSGETATPDLSDAVAALIFTDFSPPDDKWSQELLIINHHGSMSSYFVDRDNGFLLRYTFALASQYPRGISSVSYCPRHKILLVGGSGVAEESSETAGARGEGITAWRLLSDTPFCKLITDYEEEKEKAKTKTSFLSLMRVTSIFQRRHAQVDGIYRLCLSPCGTTLVAVHFSGKLSLWQVPSLRLVREFLLEDQPDWDEISPDFIGNPSKSKRMKDLVPHKQLIDVNFWSETLLILARCTGAVSVVSPEELRNRLGKSPEWFEPSPQVTQAQNGGFLGLECEVRFPKKRIGLLTEGEEEEEEDSEDEDVSLVAQGTLMTKQVLFYLTDSERFQPPKKKPRYVTKLHRIVQLKSTTPEELYTRKIEAEEYGEALALAQAYNLDCDRVYQRQWRKADVSLASIQDYLSKISKRAWVLHECLERVPENIDAMKELMEYGLRGTDLPALIAVGNGEDGGRFILCDPDEGLYEEIYDEFDPESHRRREEKRKELRDALLEQVHFSNLNLEQKELCRARLKFLQYLDRLRTYECILGGEVAAADRYNASFYAAFRSRSIYEIVAEYAQDNDWRAVETLMTFHSADLAPHRLAILSNFPETADPGDYKSLLPEIGDDGEVVSWETDQWRDEDWAQDPACRKAVDLGSEDEAAFLYTDFDGKYRTENLTTSVVQEWYLERAVEIERRSRLVDLAIELVKLGIERDVENLSELLDELITMEMMVYDCGVDGSLTFARLKEMADYDRLELFMSQSSEEMCAKNLRRWTVPYLLRCEQREPGAYDRLLRDFILTRARNDLSSVLKIFEESKASVSAPVIRTATELMSLVLDTLYSCERDDQLHVATEIFKCLPAHHSDGSSESPESLRLHKQADQLEYHLSAAKIFEENNMKMTLAYIKSAENDPEESRSLMVKLTRLAGKRSLPLTEMEWHKLHDSVMLLQNKVFRCVSRNVCHEIFVESLMCSSRQDTIRLAGTMLERSCTETKASRSQRGTSLDKVTYSRAVELTLSAAREYFDSSANLNDPCMDLARSCLNLILDAPQPIQAELDLIASLALLEEFGVAILPLQVRLSTNRLELVKKAVSSKPTSYKQTQRLLRLGQLLGIEDKDNSEGMIGQLCAEAAVAALDYEFAYQCCERLINLCHSPAWSVCVKLAELEGFRNIDAKAKLLSFALTYCDRDMIPPVLQARCLLETQILYEQVNRAVNDTREGSSEYSESRESPFSARAAIQQTQEILSSTRRTTSAVLSTVTDGRWWQSAVTSLKQPARRTRGRAGGLSDKDDGNLAFRKQGCHPFYASIIEDCYEDVRSADYSCVWEDVEGEGGVGVGEDALSSNILRTAKLEEMLTQGATRQSAAEALLELAKQTMPRDAGLGIAYLLATPKEFPVDSCFDEFPSTDISLQLAVYYYALRVYSALQPFTPAHVYALYRQTPAKIIARVLDYVNSSDLDPEWPLEVGELVEKMKNYQGMLEDYNQACTLQRLGKGVDVIRFAEDSQYKRETIFGLAMSVEEEVFGIALSLAQRYDLPLWDVYMCHLEFLFSDSGLSIDALQTRVNKLDILSTLREQRSEFTERMMSRVYPTLAGDDLRSLAYFFGLLDGVQETLLCGLAASEHATLVKKLKSVCPAIDYKRLMDADTPPVDVLQPCLTAANINSLAKLASQIPDKRGGVLHPSSLYSKWAGRVFWADADGKPLPDTMAAWVHRYEAIGEWIQKLRPEDLVSLIDSLVFTVQGRKTLDVPTRDEITKRALKFSRQSGSGKKKKQEDTGVMTWEECGLELNSRLSHLKSLTNDTVQSFAQAEDPVFSSYAERYDLSKGNQEEVELLLVQMILDGQAVELVDDILQIAPPSSLRTRTIVQQAVNHIAAALRGEKVTSEVTVRTSWLEVLQLVVENVREHQDNGGDLVQAEDVMSLLRSFCSDAAIEVPPRLDVLRVLEKSFDLSETDRVLLTLYRTDALVSSTWPDINMSEDKIISEEARLELFSTILAKCDNRRFFVSLSKILILWPAFSCPFSSTEEVPWVRVFSAIVERLGEEAGQVINYIVGKECSEFPLNGQCAGEMFELLLKSRQTVEGVKLALRSPDKQLTERALQALDTQSQGVDDCELLQLILHKNLAARVVTMPVYSPLVQHILQSQGDSDVPEVATPTQVARQLSEAGHRAEAGSLLLQARSSHSALQTFSSALASVGYWLKKS